MARMARTVSPRRVLPARTIEASLEAVELLVAEDEDVAAEAVDDAFEVAEVANPEEDAFETPLDSTLDGVPEADVAVAAADDPVLLAVDGDALAVAQICATAESMARSRRQTLFRDGPYNRGTHRLDRSECKCCCW